MSALSLVPQASAQREVKVRAVCACIGCSAQPCLSLPSSPINRKLSSLSPVRLPPLSWLPDWEGAKVTLAPTYHLEERVLTRQVPYPPPLAPP